jgi:hypothetical protein
MRTDKTAIACAIVLFLLGPMSTTLIADESQAGPEAQAHAVQSLGTSITAQDIWSVQCRVGTTTVQARVRDLGGTDGVRMRVSVLDLRGRSVSAQSPDQAAFSPFAVLSAGPGHYLVLVMRAADIAALTNEDYDLDIFCRNAGGGDTTQSILLVQNQ